MATKSLKHDIVPAEAGARGKSASGNGKARGATTASKPRKRKPAPVPVNGVTDLNGAPALPAGAAPAIASLPLASRLRVPTSLDPIGESGAAIADSLHATRMLAVSNLFDGISQVHNSLNQLIVKLMDPLAPPQLISSLAEPDGTPGVHLQVQFNPATLGSTSPVTSVITDDSGAFHLPLPSGLKLPFGSQLALSIHGGNGNATLQVSAAQIAANGLVPALVLPQRLEPLNESIVASLVDLMVKAPRSAAAPQVNPAQLPTVKLGEADGCMLSYGANPAIDRFPFGVFHRMIEPRASILSQTLRLGAGNGFTWLPIYASGSSQQLVPAGPGAPTDGTVSYVDRIPVEQPISVDGFRDQLMGLQENDTFTADETRPMAGTLGLGYTLWLAQRWQYQGLALGNLVYSLPLAPGEQQQVAIFERTDTASVFESESFTEEQQIQEQALADTSTHATFNSAFHEAAHGSNSFQTNSTSDSWGASSILVSGGGGSSSSSGTSQSSLQGQRDTTQTACQNTHSAAENQAAARRTAARTGMRVATASESEQVTTKTITNHNHTRALTLQYWEVQRVYDVSTTIEGLTMTVLVPLQVVRFMSRGQPRTLTAPNQLNSRQAVLDRYSVIIKHGDVLLQALPRRYSKGLQMLLEFASDPGAAVDASNASAEDLVHFELRGRFLSCDAVSVTAVTSRGTRVGPLYFTNPAPTPAPDKFTSKDELLQSLAAERQNGSQLMSGAVALPGSVSRSEVVGFEIQRAMRPLSYTLQPPGIANAFALTDKFGVNTPWVGQVLQATNGLGNQPRTTVSLSPAELESTLGGPELLSFNASVSDSAGGAGVNEQYTAWGAAMVLPQQPFPVAAAHVAPVLKYKQLLEIEQMASHVVRQTLLYSKAIWASMSAEERAILLEAYTIGVPTGGMQDATQMVPLLNCVENRVLGYFGNSMMLPFILPSQLVGTTVEGSQVDPAKIQEALLAFHADGFQSPRSTIALPTRGVLGEAVLGSCPSAEKIDITRFWNWQDAPADNAPAIAPTSLPAGSASIAAGLTAPNSLGQLPSLINNVLTAPAPDNSLLTALGADALNQKSFDTSLTGAKELAGLITNAQTTANAARGDALATTKQLNAQAMATVGNIVGGLYGGGNFNAGSNAAAAVNGGSQLNPNPKPTPGPSGEKKGATGGGKAGGKSGGPTGGHSGDPSSGGPGAGPSSGGPGDGPQIGPIMGPRR